VRHAVAYDINKSISSFACVAYGLVGCPEPVSRNVIRKAYHALFINPDGKSRDAIKLCLMLRKSKEKRRLPLP